MNGPPNAKRGLRAALKTAELLVAYRLLASLASSIRFCVLVDRTTHGTADRIVNETKGA